MSTAFTTNQKGDMPMAVMHLLITISIILILILLFKINAAISLIIGSLYMGIAMQLSLVDTVNAIGEGFGGTMGAIGLPIGFGVIIGQLMSDSGAAHTIAHSMIEKSPKKMAMYALGLTGFFLSIPVFFDVTFVILVPLGVAIAKELNKPLPYAIGALVIGAATAHTLVPPTPNPLAAASILNMDLGVITIAGLSIGLVTSLIVMKVFFLILDKGLWNNEKDVEGEMKLQKTKADQLSPAQRPSFLLSLLPILVPIILILLGTVFDFIVKGEYVSNLTEIPGFITFLSNRIVALLFGVILAYVIASKSMDKKEKDEASSLGLQTAGIVLLVTGAGGALGKVIETTEVGKTLIGGVSENTSSPITLILITYLIAVIFRVAQGSGTVAGITAMTIMASAATSGIVHPVWIAMAALSGGISIGHVNDSGFWITTKLSGFSIRGGFKTYTLGEALVSLVIIVITLVGVIIYPA
ncbi:GntP family permease [Halobacillus salinarum]|uniref:GntP family permease n=1 Tax=Halobacillus salinarum TaxID=2932257 RepID=A0ABY4EII9_9BACI|nr:GntP family permease [Halobacillus salinarum]UOQ44290.1 GntP family permease [Halobacillus salinarum]